MNVGAAIANIIIQGIYDGSTDRDRRRAFEEAWALHHDPEAQAEKKRRESFARLEKWAHDRRAAKRAAAVATSGPGWRVLDSPTVPHSELEQLARHAWDLAFAALPWPRGWTAKWADLVNAYGRVEHAPKLVLIDERSQRGRTWPQFVETICHELAHVGHPGEVHGPGFEETLRRVVAHVIAPDALAEAAPVEVAARPRPAPRTGVHWHDGRPVSHPTPGQWEYR